MFRSIRRIVMLAILINCASAVSAVDLPSKGNDTPVVLAASSGPGALPDDPTAPIGGGLAILLGFSLFYVLRKNKNA